MPVLLIVWHSRTGGSRQMASAVETAALAQRGVTVKRQAARLTRPEHVLAASGLILVGPENLAGLSGPMKDFFDRCYYPLLDRCPGLPYAALICAGSDGCGAHRQLARIAQGLRWRPVCEPLIVNTKAQSAEAILASKQIANEDLSRCAEVGATLAAGLAMGIW